MNKDERFNKFIKEHPNHFRLSSSLLTIKKRQMEKQKTQKYSGHTERVDYYFYLYSEKKFSLQKIGDMENISRERVRQLLTEKTEYSLLPDNRKLGRATVIFTCKNCKKIFEKNKGKKTPTFCSQDCYWAFKYITPDEFKKRASARARLWYHTIFKKRSNWHKIVSERNKRYAAKRGKK